MSSRCLTFNSTMPRNFVSNALTFRERRSTSS